MASEPGYNDFAAETGALSSMSSEGCCTKKSHDADKKQQSKISKLA